MIHRGIGKNCVTGGALDGWRNLANNIVSAKTSDKCIQESVKDEKKNT